MTKYICKFILWCIGWHYEGAPPADKKYIVISVPHTSMMDFILGWLHFRSVGIKTIIFIKKELFFFPLGILLKALGAKPVNRGRGALGLIEQVIYHFEKNDEFIVCITPEGTRNLVKKWKRGFYFIAEKANVPVYLGKLDYKRKIATVGQTKFMPSGDVEKDFDFIRNYYKNENPTPKHAEKFTFDFV